MNQARPAFIFSTILIVLLTVMLLVPFSIAITPFADRISSSCDFVRGGGSTNICHWDKVKAVILISFITSSLIAFFVRLKAKFGSNQECVMAIVYLFLFPHANRFLYELVTRNLYGAELGVFNLWFLPTLLVLNMVVFCVLAFSKKSYN